MIVKTINEYEFIEAFRTMDREASFTVAARRELFEYYEELSESLGEPFEMDVIAICCEWQELTGDELIEEYADPDYDEPSDPDEQLEILLDRLQDDTTVIEVEQYDEPSNYLVQAW